MDKKAEMQKVLDGRAELLEKISNIRTKLHDMNYGALHDIQTSIGIDAATLAKAEPFWDGLTDERIESEKKDLQHDKVMVSTVCNFIDDLEYYLNSLTQ